MDDRFEPKDPSRRVKAVLIVIVLHVLLAYALVSGLARKGLNAINKPLEAVVIQEVIIPPSISTPTPRPRPRPPPTPAPKETRKPQEVLKREAPPPPSMPPSDAAPEASSTAPVVASAAPAPTAPAEVAALPPAPSPLGPPGPKRTSIGLVCPMQVPPEMPRKALQEGIEGVVKAQIHVKDGTILDVTILSGPRVFHAAVKAAMLQYRCVTDGGEVTATQEFTFRLE